MSQPNADHSRCGLSLLEVIISIGIVCFLFALLMPAGCVYPREAARRTQCKNNLKQFGIALHNYHDFHRQLPPAYILELNVTETNKFDRYNWAQSWQTSILPYCEQEPLDKQLTESGGIANQEKSSRITSTKIGFFICPSTEHKAKQTRNITIPEFTFINSFTSTEPIEIVSGQCDYSNVSGISGMLKLKALEEDGDSSTEDFRGTMPQSIVLLGGRRTGEVLSSSDGTRLRDIKDGTANTFMVVEFAGRNELRQARKRIQPKVTYDENNANECMNDPGCLHAARYAGGWANPFSGDSWISGVPQYEDDKSQSLCVINCGTSQGIDSGLYSLHEGGVQVVMADGAVRFVSKTMSLPLFSRLVTRNDKKLAGAF